MTLIDTVPVNSRLVHPVSFEVAELLNGKRFYKNQKTDLSKVDDKRSLVSSRMNGDHTLVLDKFKPVACLDTIAQIAIQAGHYHGHDWKSIVNTFKTYLESLRDNNLGNKDGRHFDIAGNRNFIRDKILKHLFVNVIDP